MLSGLLITIDILIGCALVAVVLMQRSEGGAFGMGGGNAGGTSQVPKVTPQLVEFDLQHAINAGDVPFAAPTGSPGTPGTPGPPAVPAVKTRSKIPVEATTP